MTRFFSLLLLTSLCACKVLVPQKYRQYISDDPWKHIRLAKEGETPSACDSMVLMYTNRVLHPERDKILGDYIDSTGATRPFLLTAQQGQWVLFPIGSVEEGILSLPKRNLVVYAEGMGKNFVLAAERAFGVSEQYGVTVVMMDYPGINPDYGMNKNFKFSQRNSFNTALPLAKLLNELRHDKEKSSALQEVKWTLFFHSMGNIMFKRFLEERMDTLANEPLFDVVVLNAACVPQKKHNAWLVRCALGKKVLVHYNKQDKQLKGAMILTFKRQLGCRPKPPLAGNVHYVNFNLLVGNRHSTFVDVTGRPPIHPKARTYFQQIFDGSTPDYKDTKQFGKGWKNVGVSLR